MPAIKDTPPDSQGKPPGHDLKVNYLICSMHINIEVLKQSCISNRLAKKFMTLAENAVIGAGCVSNTGPFCGFFLCFDMSHLIDLVDAKM